MEVNPLLMPFQMLPLPSSFALSRRKAFLSRSKHPTPPDLTGLLALPLPTPFLICCASSMQLPGTRRQHNPPDLQRRFPPIALLFLSRHALGPFQPTRPSTGS